MMEQFEINNLSHLAEFSRTVFAVYEELCAFEARSGNPDDIVAEVRNRDGSVRRIKRSDLPNNGNDGLKRVVASTVAYDDAPRIIAIYHEMRTMAKELGLPARKAINMQLAKRFLPGFPKV